MDCNELQCWMSIPGLKHRTSQLDKLYQDLIKLSFKVN